MTLELLTPARALHSPNHYEPDPDCPREGVMLHFDDSSSDEAAWKWFIDPACHVSYNRLYLDNGTVVQITPSIESVAWHAGVCITPHANYRYYGLAAATNTKVPATEAQVRAIAHDTAALFIANHWPTADVERRICGHEDEACYGQRDYPKHPEMWGQLGRKIDPTGYHKSHPILSTARVRAIVLELLTHERREHAA